jgi:hypothetical protein
VRKKSARRELKYVYAIFKQLRLKLNYIFLNNKAICDGFENSNYAEELKNDIKSRFPRPNSVFTSNQTTK